MRRSRIDIRAAAFWVGATVIFIVMAGGLLALSGLYSVAASRGHFVWTKKFLEIGMRRSVATHSLLVDAPPPLDDPQLIRVGGGHYAGGCERCHGSPASRSDPVVDRMLPPPPSLIGVAESWSDRQLFWIVANGLKYTGMPAWVAPGRNDEVWAVVAFLRALTKMTAAEYRAITRSGLAKEESTPSELARFGGQNRSISMCVRCHGAETIPPSSTMVPVIAGQSAEYLERALRQYADGRRPSGMMQPVAAALDEEALLQLAKYYAGLSALQASRSRASEQEVQRGQAIATKGLPKRDVPACLTCHAGGVAAFPTLSGQHAAYLANQLRLWQRGLREDTVYGAIMAPIAKRLTEKDIDDVSAFFASFGVSTDQDHQTEGRRVP
jgi:cytochrome c553